MSVKTDRELEEIEINLLLEGIYLFYGYDFRDYALSSLKRRIKKCMQDDGVETISGYQQKILHDPLVMNRFIDAMSINVTEMFRDPQFYFSFKENVIPQLKSLPIIRMWHAGCSTGEEAYSMAILLKEAGLLEKTKLYATDMNDTALQKAKEGIFRLKSINEYSNYYFETGGQESLSKYYHAKYDHVIINNVIKENIIWAVHNLVTDSSFNEFNAIICRNVLIYFNEVLQAHVHKLFYDSLAEGGFLILGSKENLKFTPYENRYENYDAKWKIYRKIR